MSINEFENISSHGHTGDAILEVGRKISEVGFSLPSDLTMDHRGKIFYLLTRSVVAEVSTAGPLSTSDTGLDWTGSLSSSSTANSGEELYIGNTEDYITLSGGINNSSTTAVFSVSRYGIEQGTALTLNRQRATPYVWTGNRWQITS